MGGRKQTSDFLFGGQENKKAKPNQTKSTRHAAVQIKAK